MKKNLAKTAIIFLISSFALHTQAAALLTCQVGIGNHQEISVEKLGQELFLFELDEAGRQRQRPLSETELASGQLQLYTDKYGGLNTLTQDSENEMVWVYKYTLGNLKITQVIECE